ncbi:MAG: hypothetical protein AB2L20_15350 [Mangrovibacterium sp.]
MNESLTIPKEPDETIGKSWAFLRAEGLKYIEQLSSGLWTDYNIHDPGVTTLELLCYALTDLEYRIAMPVEDLLARPAGNMQHMHGQFLSAIKALPSAPVTADDYRELFVRIDGVRNAWILPSPRGVIARYRQTAVSGKPELRYKKEGEQADPEREIEFGLQGLNRILIDYDQSRLPLAEDHPELSEGELELLIMKAKADIVSLVTQVYHRYRNLCEDLDTVAEVPPQGVVVCGDIELMPAADPEQVWARIVFNIDRYLSPDIPFYNLGEMRGMGKTADEIFAGPVFDFRDDYPYRTPGNPFARKGFIRKEDLRESELRKEVRLSDLIRVIMETEGVSLIRDIEFGLCSCSEEDRDVVRSAVSRDKWNLCISPGHKPVFCTDNSVLNLWKGPVPVELKRAEAQQRLQKIRSAYREAVLLKVTSDLPIPEGGFSDVKHYGSFQNDFPGVYGIGREGLPESASTGRKAQAKQLKAYLLFFDQVLACYFAQLAHAGELLSADASRTQTYFANGIKNLGDADQLFSNEEHWETAIEELLAEAELDPYVERKNRFLDHLLARFAEQFNEYVFLMYRLYEKDAGRAVIRQKVRFLRDYPRLSAFRGSGLDYLNPLSVGNTPENVSGMERRLSLMLGYNPSRKRRLSELPCSVGKTHVKNLVLNGVDTEVQCYGWTISREGELVFESLNRDFIKKADAWEEIGLAALLASDPAFYLTEQNGNKLTILLKDSSEKKLAVHPGLFDNQAAQERVAGLIDYFTNEFRPEGLYVLEHILLRPDLGILSGDQPFLPVCIDANGSYCPPVDPYSFRVTVVLPGYGMRLRDKHFRRFAERIIRMETPAHVLPRICFVSEEMMKKFEDTYLAWLNEREKSADPLKQASKQTLTSLMAVLEELFTVYEEGQLSDCDDDTIEKNPVILGSSTLGSLETNSNPDH